MLKPKILTEKNTNPDGLGPLTLAYLGDGVYEVYIDVTWLRAEL